jgi:nitrate/nitrite transporter NarK
LTVAGAIGLPADGVKMTGVIPIWSVPMDIAPKHAGTAAGIMNTGVRSGGVVSPTVFGYVVDLTGSWVLPFAGSIGLLLVGSVLTFWMRPDRSIGAAPTTGRPQIA